MGLFSMLDVAIILRALKEHNFLLDWILRLCVAHTYIVSLNGYVLYIAGFRFASLIFDMNEWVMMLRLMRYTYNSDRHLYLYT